MIDLGDPVPLSVEVRDPAGALADAGAVTLTITQPDGTTATPTVTKASTGVYTAAYVPATAGIHAIRWVATGANASAYADTFTVAPANPPLALPLPDAKAFLGIPVTTTSDDEELRDTIAEAQDMIERAAGVALTARTIIETHPGGTAAIALWRPPVRSVTSVAVDGTTLPATAWKLHGGGDRAATIVPAAGVFAGDQVTVTYAAGWQAPPAVVARTMKALVAHLWATQRGSMSGRAGSPFDSPAPSGAPPGAAWSMPIRVEQVKALIQGPGIGI